MYVLFLTVSMSQGFRSSLSGWSWLGDGWSIHCWLKLKSPKGLTGAERALPEWLSHVVVPWSWLLVGGVKSSSHRPLHNAARGWLPESELSRRPWRRMQMSAVTAFWVTHCHCFSILWLIRVRRDSVWEGNTQAHGYQEMKAIGGSLGGWGSLGAWVPLTKRPDWCIMVTDVPPQG